MQMCHFADERGACEKKCRQQTAWLWQKGDGTIKMLVLVMGGQTAPSLRHNKASLYVAY